MKHWVFRHHLFISLVGFGALAIYLAVSPKDDDHIGRTLSIAAAIIAFVAFVQRQQIEEMRIFMQLFKDFNARYDELNEGMNAIAEGSPANPLSKEETNLLNDYFNLCAEEYLCFRKGFIQPEVWTAWRNGIKCFLRHERIGKRWREEARAGSYYGLESEDL